MTTTLRLVVIVFAPACVADVEMGVTQHEVTLEQRIAACNQDPRVVAGAVNRDVCVGADLFFRETFNGNGRSCATCHPVANNFTIDVPFIASLPASDPLFIAEQDPDLAGLEIPAQMRARGLILENVDGVAPDPRVRFVLRSVPHNFSMGTSVTRSAADPVNPPADRTGWSGDGAPDAGALRDFQNGAIFQHYTRSLDRIVNVDFRRATDGELDRIDLFMRRLGRTNDLDLATVVMSDARAEAGRGVFNTVGCNVCHQNAGANFTVLGGNFNFDTGVEVARQAPLAGFPRDGGFGSNPRDDGSFGNGTFNPPPLVEAADTGPFFHTATTVSGASGRNAAIATTIEEAVAFYDTPAFNTSPSGVFAPIDMTATQIDDVGRFLRGVNAAFNAALAIKRLDATTAVIGRFINGNLATQRELLRLANVEVQDAIDVLGGVSQLNTQSRLGLILARQLISDARATSSAFTRLFNIQAARTLVEDASDGIGTNLSFAIADGTNMF